MKMTRNFWILASVALLWGCSPAADTSPSDEPVGSSGGAGKGGTSNGTGGSKMDSGSAGTSQMGTGGAANDASSDAPMGDPTLLSQTGLYADIAKGTLAPDVVAFQPQFALWSDGATKKRWVKFPPGKKIDTSDMDYWQYPVGIKLFKEFTRDGVRVETRMIWKRDVGDWFMSAYKWNKDQTEATVVVNGEQNVSGTQHDIPAQSDCSTCHGAMKDKVIGFSAVQLSHSIAGSLNIDQMVTNGWLTNPPAAKLVVPGDDVAKAALGYLHANCGVCHNEQSKVGIILGADMYLHADRLATVMGTSTYTSCVNQDTKGGISGLGKRIVPGKPDLSAVYEVMNLREMMNLDGGESRQMPPLASELVDPTGTAAIKAWITVLK
jgi:hypothetical protein